MKLLLTLPPEHFFFVIDDIKVIEITFSITQLEAISKRDRNILVTSQNAVGTVIGAKELSDALIIFDIVDVLLLLDSSFIGVISFRQYGGTCRLHLIFRRLINVFILIAIIGFATYQWVRQDFPIR